MARVFISHASEALALADELHRWLVDDGHQVFLGRFRDCPFDVDRHRVFFGRTGEVDQLAGLLRSTAERAEGAALLGS